MAQILHQIKKPVKIKQFVVALKRTLETIILILLNLTLIYINTFLFINL